MPPETGSSVPARPEATTFWGRSSRPFGEETNPAGPREGGTLWTTWIYDFEGSIIPGGGTGHLCFALKDTLRHSLGKVVHPLLVPEDIHF